MYRRADETARRQHAEAARQNKKRRTKLLLAKAMRTRLKNEVLKERVVIPVDVEVSLKSACLLGHILRRESGETLRDVFMEIDGFIPNLEEKNRVGRPYLLWYEKTAEVVWGHLCPEMGYSPDTEFDIKDRNHLFLLAIVAHARVF